jgi:hypothetical protein
VTSLLFAVAVQVVQSACIAAAGPNIAFVLSFIALHGFGKQSGSLAVAKQVVAEQLQDLTWASCSSE